MACGIGAYITVGRRSFFRGSTPAHQKSQASVQFYNIHFGQPTLFSIELLKKLRGENLSGEVRELKFQVCFVKIYKMSSKSTILVCSSIEVIHCWFRLTGQNAVNLKFKTCFSQIGLSLGESLWRQNLLKILAELIWCNLFCEIRAQQFTPKMGHFGFFELFENYAKKNESITDIITLRWAPYVAQQILWNVYSPKHCIS